MNNFIHIERKLNEQQIYNYPVVVNLDQVNYFYRYSYQDKGSWKIIFVCNNGKETHWIFETKEERDEYYQKLLDYTDSTDLSKTIKI